MAKYGLSVLVTSDEGLKSYLTQVLRQLAEWLTKGAVQKLCVVITGVETKEVLERWVFNIDTDKAAMAPGVVRTKSQKDIQGEIQAIIRQVTACVTFLPLLEEPCTFDLLVYTNTDAAVPKAWEESDPKVRSGEGGICGVGVVSCASKGACVPVCPCFFTARYSTCYIHLHALSLSLSLIAPARTISILLLAQKYACDRSPPPSTRLPLLCEYSIAMPFVAHLWTNHCFFSRTIHTTLVLSVTCARSHTFTPNTDTLQEL